MEPKPDPPPRAGASKHHHIGLPQKPFVTLPVRAAGNPELTVAQTFALP